MTKTLEESGRHAFPSDRTGGMTLRDYFAAKAMQAIMSNNGRFDSTTFDDLSVKSYAAADAMLKARQQ